MEEKTTQVQVINGQITFNFEEMKAYILATLEEYKGAVFVGEDSIKMAKGIVADLRKNQAALKNDVSTYKKAYMEPWEAFKAQADEIIALYDEPITLINGQVQEFTERQKAEKREKIKEAYTKVFQDLEEYSLESIYNPRWENATFKMKEVEQELFTIRYEIEQDLQTIQMYMSESVPQALEMYKKSRKLSECIAYITNYENQRSQILAQEAERKHQEELERIRKEEREKIEAEMKAEAEKKAAVEQAKNDAAAETIEAMIPERQDGEPADDYLYSITLTAAEKEALEIYLDSVGIEWEVM